MTEQSTPKWNEPGEYVFSKDGKLTATFSQDSYVQVKTLHGEYWYAFENYVKDGTTTKLFEASDSYKEKMFVPANTQVTFTLSKAQDGAFQLGYVVGTTPTTTEEPTVTEAPTTTETPTSSEATPDFSKFSKQKHQQIRSIAAARIGQQ